MMRPYGYNRIQDGTLVPNLVEQVGLGEIWRFRREGRSYWEIAQMLSAFGARTANGSADWNAAMVEEICKRGERP